MSKTALILAGGKSTRMGFDKTRLRFGDRRLIDVVIDHLRPHVDDLIVVSNHPEDWLDLVGVRIVTDAHAGQGPLGGIFSGLLASTSRHNIVVGCDMPFLNPLVLDYLWSLRNWGDVIVPLTHSVLAPVCAVYDRGVVAVLAQALQAGERQVMGVYPKLNVHYVREEELRPYDPDLHSLDNINTPADYEAALQIWATRSH